MAEEHEVIEFELSKELTRKVERLFYDTDNNILNVYVKSESEKCKSKPLKSKVDKSSMRNTLEQFNERVDGTLDKEIKLLCVYSIKYHLRRYVKFDTAEQKWYSENYPNDPSLAKPTSVRKVAIVVQEATEEIMAKYRFLTIEETDEVLVYDNGVYKPGGKTLIAKDLEAAYGYELNTHSLSQITGHIMRRTYHKHKDLDADINIINLKNGLYDIENGVLPPHNPKYLSVKQKPIKCDKDAKPELFHKFISEVVYEQEIQTAIDIIAYTFRRDYDIEVIFKLFGLGNNGKHQRIIK